MAGYQRTWLDWLTVLVWMGVIFALSDRPDLHSGFEGVWDRILRKAAHIVEYGILGWLVARALGAGKRFAIAPTAFVFCLLYAASDEWHQTLVAGRHGAVTDVLIDSIGIALGIMLYLRRR